MASVNDVTKTAKAAANVVVDRARYVTELVRINVAIAGEQKEIEKNILLIGQWFIDDYEGEVPESVKGLVDAVNASKAKIAELEASKPAKPEPPAEEAKADEAAADEDKPAGKPCPICGEVSDSRFCPHCGAPMGE